MEAVETTSVQGTLGHNETGQVSVIGKLNMF